MGQHRAGVIVFHQHVGKQADVLPASASKVISVAHQVEAWPVVLAQRPVGEPLSEQARRLLVSRLRVHRVRLLAALQMHGVVPAARLQICLQFRPNHVVGRADHVGKAADNGGVKAAAAKGFQNGHGCDDSGNRIAALYGNGAPAPPSVLLAHMPLWEMVTIGIVAILAESRSFPFTSVHLSRS